MKKLFIYLSLFLIITPWFAIKAATPPPANNDPNRTDPGAGKNAVPSGTVTLDNPLKAAGIETPQQFIGKMINGVLGIIGSIALAMFVFGGFTWMTSAGNPQAVTKGKSTMIWAALGLAIIFSAYTLTKFVIDAVAKG